MLGEVLPGSCHMVFEYFVGIVTLGVGLPAWFRMPSVLLLIEF
jgi:hypothetical protein